MYYLATYLKSLPRFVTSQLMWLQIVLIAKIVYGPVWPQLSAHSPNIRHHDTSAAAATFISKLKSNQLPDVVSH